jgi:hypothetical protein
MNFFYEHFIFASIISLPLQSLGLLHCNLHSYCQKDSLNVIDMEYYFNYEGGAEHPYLSSLQWWKLTEIWNCINEVFESKKTVPK